MAFSCPDLQKKNREESTDNGVLLSIVYEYGTFCVAGAVAVSAVAGRTK